MLMATAMFTLNPRLAVFPKEPKKFLSNKVTKCNLPEGGGGAAVGAR